MPVGMDTKAYAQCDSLSMKLLEVRLERRTDGGGLVWAQGWTANRLRRWCFRTGQEAGLHQSSHGLTLSRPCRRSPVRQAPEKLSEAGTQGWQEEERAPGRKQGLQSGGDSYTHAA